MKYIKALREHFATYPVFRMRDVKAFLSPYEPSDEYLNVLVHHLLKRGEIQRLTRGVYTFRREAEVVGFAFSPFYYGLQEALSFHNLWEQETNPVIITPRRVRTGARKIAGTNVIVRRVGRRMFFGFDTIRFHDLYLPVSDIEKTLIDFFYYRERLGDDVLEEIERCLRKDVLRAYLKKTPGYVREAVGKRMPI